MPYRDYAADKGEYIFKQFILFVVLKILIINTNSNYIEIII